MNTFSRPPEVVSDRRDGWDRIVTYSDGRVRVMGNWYLPAVVDWSKEGNGGWLFGTANDPYWSAGYAVYGRPYLVRDAREGNDRVLDYSDGSQNRVVDYFLDAPAPLQEGALAASPVLIRQSGVPQYAEPNQQPKNAINAAPIIPSFDRAPAPPVRMAATKDPVPFYTVNPSVPPLSTASPYTGPFVGPIGQDPSETSLPAQPSGGVDASGVVPLAVVPGTPSYVPDASTIDVPTSLPSLPNGGPVVPTAENTGTGGQLNFYPTSATSGGNPAVPPLERSWFEGPLMGASPASVSPVLLLAAVAVAVYLLS